MVAQITRASNAYPLRAELAELSILQYLQELGWRPRLSSPIHREERAAIARLLAALEVTAGECALFISKKLAFKQRIGIAGSSPQYGPLARDDPRGSVWH